jgi:lipopolysaccharide biosynthesis glycosyltransferase
VPILFPELDKALYLDSDIVVLDDIAKLYNFNLGNNLVGAARDEVLSFNSEFKKYADMTVGVHHMKYFNAGILLMNLEEFRRQDIFNKFLNLMKVKKYPVAQDQDYLNVLCKDKVKKLPLSWNKTPVKQFYFNDKFVKICHFKMAFKPWKYKGILYEEYFWKYAKETEYYDFFKNILDNFTEEDAKKDKEAADSLYQLVVRENNLAIEERQKETLVYVRQNTRYC